MKKTILLLSVMLISLLPAKADEGMWLLPLLEKLNAERMAELGFTITPEEIYSIQKSSVKDAIVIFGGGCTGEIVSKNGLLFTNHHCGYGAIQKLSSVENDYLNDGFWAMNNKEELPAQGLSVTFLETFVDVTDLMNEAQAKAAKKKSAKDKEKIIAKLYESLDKKYIGKNEYLRGRVQSFYGGNAYYYIVYKTYTDVRLVGTPPSSIGKFGADTDNWMWPRHTGDFAVFRVYADANNNPAQYSANNVPYTPKQHLKVSIKGVKENDPTFIMGYPGSTNRFMTSAELDETQNISNAIRIKVRGVRQDVLMADMEADPKIRIQYSSKYAGSSNGWKKYIGMNETFVKLGVKERREQEEIKFSEWVSQDPTRVEKYGKALEKINTAVSNRKNALTKQIYLSESVGRVEIVSFANQMVGYQNRINQAEEKDKAAILRTANARIESFFKDYSFPTDRKVANALIKLYTEDVPVKDQPAFASVIRNDFSGNVEKYVDYIFDNSVFGSKDKIAAALKNNTSLMDDPAYVLAQSVYSTLGTLSQQLREPSAQLAEGKKEYIGGTLELRNETGEAIYPDANSTMRFTYGQVLPYSPRDAVEYEIITTLDGVIEKEDPNNWEFVVPAKLKQLWKDQDFGEYALPNGKMPLAFISNNDITGGNSGSPIMNGAGELIGLAFDGNWEAMSGDIIFEPKLQRTISVDVRYVLFIIDKFGGAGYLIDEMDIVR